MTIYYLIGLIRVAQLFILEDTQQYALIIEKHKWWYNFKSLVFRRLDESVQKGIKAYTVNIFSY
jgi:hypothetical protein